MDNGWKIRKIGSLGRVITGKTPRTVESENFDGEYPFITIPDLDGSVYIYKSERTLSETGARKVIGSLLPSNAVMMSCIATIGKCGITAIPSITNQQINSVICNSDVNPRFLYYIFTQLGQELDAAGGGGSVYINVSKSRFSDIEILLPPLPEQCAIAELLGSLDDKIELNRRMNTTLEAMASMLFRQWFVESEEAKEWETGKLCDIAYFVKGVSYRSSELAESSNTALVTLKCMERGGGYREDGLKPFSGEYKPPQRVFPGEIVIAHTDLTQAADVVGRAARVEPNEKHPILVASLDMVIVRPKGKPYSPEYLYGVLSRGDFADHAYGYTNGTTVLHLSSKALPEYPIKIPPKSKVEEYAKMVLPIYAQIHNNKGQSRTLASLRDTLLPYIMGGKIRVRELSYIL